MTLSVPGVIIIIIGIPPAPVIDPAVQVVINIVTGDFIFVYPYLVGQILVRPAITGVEDTYHDILGALHILPYK